MLDRGLVPRLSIGALQLSIRRSTVHFLPLPGSVSASQGAHCLGRRNQLNNSEMHLVTRNPRPPDRCLVRLCCVGGMRRGQSRSGSNTKRLILAGYFIVILSASATDAKEGAPTSTQPNSPDGNLYFR